MVIYANSQSTGCRGVSAYEPGNTARTGQNGEDPSSQAREKMGIPGIGPCGLPPVFIFSTSASAAEWL